MGCTSGAASMTVGLPWVLPASNESVIGTRTTGITVVPPCAGYDPQAHKKNSRCDIGRKVRCPGRMRSAKTDCRIGTAIHRTLALQFASGPVSGPSISVEPWLARTQIGLSVLLRTASILLLVGYLTTIAQAARRIVELGNRMNVSESISVQSGTRCGLKLLATEPQSARV